MTTVSKGKGIFKLEDSDHYVGSLFSFDDVVEILHIVDVEAFRTHLEENRLVGKDGYIDESHFYSRSWNSNLKPFMNQTYYYYNASWDEYVLFAIIRRTYPKTVIEQQATVVIDGRKRQIDFKVSIPSISKTFYLEVDGTTHFIQYSAKPPEDPRIKLAKIREAAGCET